MTELQLMTGEPEPHLGMGPAVADRRAERLKGSGAAAFVAEKLRIGDFILASDTLEEVTLEKSMLAHTNGLPVVYCRRLRQSETPTRLGRRSCRSTQIPCLLQRQRRRMRWTMPVPSQWCETDGVRGRGGSGTPWQSSQRGRMVIGTRATASGACSSGWSA